MPDRQRSRGPRMTKEWNSIVGTNLVFTADATALNTFALSVAAPVTVLRMLGSAMLHPTTGGTFGSGDKARVTLGIGVISTDAFAAGSASVPDPASEPEFPWLYWADLLFFAFSATSLGEQPFAGHRVEFDIRSMRKMKPRESLVIIGQYTDLVGAPPLTVQIGQTRILLATG